MRVARSSPTSRHDARSASPRWSTSTGAAITLVDTAGLHGVPADAVEREGIERAHAARRVADLAIVVLDCSRPLRTGRSRSAGSDSTRSSRDCRQQVRSRRRHGRPRMCTRTCCRCRRRERPWRRRAARCDRRGRLPDARRRATRRRSPTSATPICWRVPPARFVGASDAAAREGTPEECVAADLGEARARSRKSPARERRTMCCRRSSASFCIGK